MSINDKYIETKSLSTHTMQQNKSTVTNGIRAGCRRPEIVDHYETCDKSSEARRASGALV